MSAPELPRTATPAERNRLADVLVLTFRKGFWASAEAERFPHRVYGRVVVGHSTNVFNTLVLAARTLVALIRVRPRLVLIGSAHRLVPVALVLRRLRLLRTGLIVTNQVFFGPRWSQYADRVIVYSHAQTHGRPGYQYLPLPADGDYDALRPSATGRPYVFAGGGTLRDFASLVEAVRGTALRLVVVTDSPETLGVEEPLPENVEVHWRMPLDRFLSLMAGSLFVAIPLHESPSPHGHTTAAQALRLGKAVVTTRGRNVETYVRDGEEGLLVDPGDVEGYRKALLALVGDEALRARCEARARERAPEFTYAAFGDALERLCGDVLDERAR